MEHCARLLRGDALGFEGELDADALTLDGVAASELRRLERFGSRDLAASCVLIPLDPIGRARLPLPDARCFDGLASLDVGFLERLRARDLAGPHFLLLGDAVRLDLSVLGDAREFDEL